MKRSFLPLCLFLLISSLLPAWSDPGSTPGEMDLKLWKLQVLKGAAATLSTNTDAPNSATNLLVDVQEGGSGELWAVQIYYPLSVTKGKTYHLKFIMKSSPEHYVFIDVTGMREPYTRLSEGKSLPLRGHWEEIEYVFTPKEDDSNARILLTNLNVPGTKFYIANVTLTMD